MDTTAELTAPQWSADPTTAINGLSATHDQACREVLHTAAHHLDGLLAHHPLPTAIDRYLAHPVGFHDRAQAFAAVVTFTELRLVEHTRPVWPGWTDPVAGAKRLLRPAEHALVRLVSRRTDLAAAQVAVLEAGASPGELILVAAESFHDDNGRLWLKLPGTSRVAARTVEIAAWAIGPLTRLCETRPHGPLLYTGGSANLKHQQCSVLMSVRKTYGYAGLNGDRTAKPDSLRNAGARATYEAAATGKLAAAGHTLGIHDTTRVAQRIGLGPRNQPAIIDWDAEVCAP